MKLKLRAFRFWLSATIFEKYLGWPNPQVIGERVDKECDNFNDKNSESYCHSCGGSKLISKISGSDGGGILAPSSPHHFYECKKCGNQQDNDGSSHKYCFKELRKVRVIEDGADRYRYELFTQRNGNQVFAGLLISLVLVGATPFFLCILSLFGIGPFAF